MIITLPARWSSAIINFDYSGLDKEECAKLNNTLANNGLSFTDCLHVSEEFYAQFDGLGDTVADYTFARGC